MPSNTNPADEQKRLFSLSGPDFLTFGIYRIRVQFYFGKCNTTLGSSETVKHKKLQKDGYMPEEGKTVDEQKIHWIHMMKRYMNYNIFMLVINMFLLIVKYILRQLFKSPKRKMQIKSVSINWFGVNKLSCKV